MKKHVASSDYSATPFAIPNGSAARRLGCHCGYKGHGLLILCWSLRCNCSTMHDIMTTQRFKYQTTLIKGLHDEKKSIVRFVVRAVCNASVKAPMVSNDSGAPFVPRPSSGRTGRTKDIRSDIGSSSGSWNIIPSDNSRTSPVIAPPSSSGSKTTGLSNPRPSARIVAHSRTWSWMARTSIRTGAW